MLRPYSGENWNYATAAHLLNRAGFGGTPVEIERLVALGPTKAVSWFVDYESIPDTTAAPEWAKPDPERAEKYRMARNATEQERRAMQQEQQKLERNRMVELRGWWLQRMATGPRPLQEKLVLFWHGHFATSVDKVKDPYCMWLQNELFRQQAMGNWLEILIAVGKDPAMLVWLDQAQSKKEHPNENFAREVMELFALGEGHYTEKDISEGARALTGWSYDRVAQKFVDRPATHDRGEKTIFGKPGNYNGEDFLELVVSQPQAATFITAKLWKFFAGQEPSKELNAALASALRRSGNSFKPVIRTMLLSEEFYAPEVVRNQVKSPVQWLVSSVRVLERGLPPPLACMALTRGLGQDLFAPPNVKGWDGGVSWITTNTLLARYNEAATLVQGDVAPMAGAITPKNGAMAANVERRMQNTRLNAVDVSKLFTEKQLGDKEAFVAVVQQRLLQGQLKPGQQKVLRDFLDTQKKLDENAARNAIRLVMSTPEYQLT